MLVGVFRGLRAECPRNASSVRRASSYVSELIRASDNMAAPLFAVSSRKFKSLCTVDPTCPKMRNTKMDLDAEEAAFQNLANSIEQEWQSPRQAHLKRLGCVTNVLIDDESKANLQLLDPTQPRQLRRYETQSPSLIHRACKAISFGIS